MTSLSIIIGEFKKKKKIIYFVIQYFKLESSNLVIFSQVSALYDVV